MIRYLPPEPYKPVAAVTQAFERIHSAGKLCIGTHSNFHLYAYAAFCFAEPLSSISVSAGSLLHWAAHMGRHDILKRLLSVYAHRYQGNATNFRVYLPIIN